MPKKSRHEKTVAIKKSIEAGIEGIYSLPETDQKQLTSFFIGHIKRKLRRKGLHANPLTVMVFIFEKADSLSTMLLSPAIIGGGKKTEIENELMKLNFLKKRYSNQFFKFSLEEISKDFRRKFNARKINEIDALAFIEERINFEKARIVVGGEEETAKNARIKMWGFLRDLVLKNIESF